MMSSDEDSDSAAKQSHGCQRILDLLKMRAHQRVVSRRLYDEIPAPRRSLKVQKLVQQVPKNINALSEKSVNNIALGGNGAKMPNHNRQRKQHKSMVFSTPCSIKLIPNFGISLSPVKNNIVQHKPATDESDFVDEICNEENAENNEVPEPQLNLSVVQFSEKVQRALDSPENRDYTDKSIHREMPPVSKSKSGISKSSNLREANSHLHLGTNELAGSDRYWNTGTMQKSRNSDVDLPKPVHLKSRPIRPRPRANTPISTKELLSKPTSDLLNPDNDSTAFPINSKPKSITTVKPKQNSMLLGAIGLRSSCSLHNLEQSSKFISHPADKTNLKESSAACAEINSVIIPETQNNEIEITNIETVETQTNIEIVETLHQSSETSPNQHSQETNSDSRTADNCTSASHKISNSQDANRNREPAPKQARKKKFSDSYLRFLNLEQSAKRKFSISGAKRKLYSSEQALQIPPENSDSDATRTSRSFKKITPTRLRSPPVLDLDGFKIPNTSPRTTKSKRDNVDDPIDQTSELGVIAENIRILNKSRAVLTPNISSHIEEQTIYRSPQKQRKKAKHSETKDKNTNVPKVHQTMEEDLIGVRRSKRVRHEPMTFWKVHKEPISDNRAEFYNKMFLGKSSKSNPDNKRRQVKRKRPTVERALVESDTKEPDVQIPILPSPEISTTTSRPDSGLQESTESENQTNPFMRFLTKFTASGNNAAQRNEVPIESGLDFLNIYKLDFENFSNLPGIEFAFVPNTNETLGFLKLQPGSKKRRSRASRKYFLSFMLLTDSFVTASINKTTIQMALGENDFIQLPPYSSYELINKSSEIAILMSIRSQVEECTT